MNDPDMLKLIQNAVQNASDKISEVQDKVDDSKNPDQEPKKIEVNVVENPSNSETTVPVTIENIQTNIQPEEIGNAQNTVSVDVNLELDVKATDNQLLDLDTSNLSETESVEFVTDEILQEIPVVMESKTLEYIKKILDGINIDEQMALEGDEDFKKTFSNINQLINVSGLLESYKSGKPIDKILEEVNEVKVIADTYQQDPDVSTYPAMKELLDKVSSDIKNLYQGIVSSDMEAFTGNSSDETLYSHAKDIVSKKDLYINAFGNDDELVKKFNSVLEEAEALKSDFDSIQDSSAKLRNISKSVIEELDSQVQSYVRIFEEEVEKNGLTGEDADINLDIGFKELVNTTNSLKQRLWGHNQGVLTDEELDLLRSLDSGENILNILARSTDIIRKYNKKPLISNALRAESDPLILGYKLRDDKKLAQIDTRTIDSAISGAKKAFSKNSNLVGLLSRLQDIYKDLADPKKYFTKADPFELENIQSQVKGIRKSIFEELIKEGFSANSVIDFVGALNEKRIKLDENSLSIFESLTGDRREFNFDDFEKDVEFYTLLKEVNMESYGDAYRYMQSYLGHAGDYSFGNIKDTIREAFTNTVLNPIQEVPEEIIALLESEGIEQISTPESAHEAFKQHLNLIISSEDIGEMSYALSRLKAAPIDPTGLPEGISSPKEWLESQEKLINALAKVSQSDEYSRKRQDLIRFKKALEAFLKDPADEDAVLTALIHGEFQQNPRSLRKYLLEHNKLKEDQITEQERLDLQNGIQSNINRALEDLSVSGKRVDTFRTQAEKTGEELPKEVSDAIAEFETIKKRLKDNPPESLAGAISIKLKAESVSQTLRNLYYGQFGDSSPASDSDKALMETELESLRIDRNRFVKDAEKYGGDAQKIKEISDEFDQALSKALEGIKNTSITISELGELYKAVETSRNTLKNTANNLRQTYTGPIETLSATQISSERANLAKRDLDAQRVYSEAVKYGADPQKLDQLIKEYQTISDEINQMLSQDVVPEDKLKDGLTRLTTAYQNLSNYSTGLKQSFVMAEDPVEKIQQRLKMIDTIIRGINSAINTVLSALKAGLNVVHKTITTLGRAIAAVPRTLTRIVQLFGNLGNRVRSVNALTNAWVVLDSKLNLVERAYNAIFSNQYLTSVQQTLGGISGLNQISGETANTIIEFAEAMEYAFGTPMSTMISQTSELALLMRSLGVQTENIANASLMISTVGLSLQASGILGGDYDAIMTKIVSGLRGETEAIADVGIDVRAKTLDDFVAKIKQAPEAFGLTADAVSNLANRTSELTEKQLVNLRILAIYNQYVQNNGELLRNYAAYMNTVVGRVNGLKSAFTTLFSTVGVVIYQIVAAIGPYLEYIIRLITSAVSALAKLLGFETSWSELSGQMSGSFDSQTGSIQDNTEATEENTAAKNSNKGSLASFDRITSIDSTSGSDSDKNSEADLSGLLSGLPNMNDLLDQYLNGDSRMDALEEKWKSMMDSMKEKFQQFANDITGHEVDITFGFDSKQFNDGLALAWESIKRALNTIGETIAYYAIRIAEDLQIGKLISGAAEGLGNITKALTDVLEIMQPIAELFYETFLSPIFKSAGESLYEWLTAGSEEFSNQWVASAESLAQRLTEAMQSENPWENFIGVISEEFPLLGNLITLIESVSKAIGSVWETVSPLIGEFGQFAQDTIIPYLADTFERMATYVDQNRESIQELLTALGEFAWDIVTTTIEGIGKVIDTIVTNKDLVMELLDGFSTAFKFVVDHPEIITLLIGGKVATTVAGGALGAAETGLDIFSSLKGLGIIGGAGAGAAGAGAAAGGIGSIAGTLPVIGVVFGAIIALVTALSNNEELAAQFSETFSDLLESIRVGLEKLQPLFEFLAQVLMIIGTVIGGAILAIASFVTAIMDLSNDLSDIITMSGDMMKAIIKGDWDTVVDIIKGVLIKIVEVAYDFASTIVNPIASFIDSIITLLNKLPGVNIEYSLKEAWDSLDLDKYKEEERHAEGGIFSQPHYALFAEDGAEAVIPLSSKYRSKALPVFMQTASILGFNLSDAITSQTSITSIPSIGSVKLPQINTGLDKQDSSGSDSIRDGIEEALFGVINQLISQGYLTKGGANNYNANTDSVLRLLARLLAPYLTAQTSNISNSGFAIR